MLLQYQLNSQRVNQLLSIAFFLLLSNLCFAQATGDFRSIGSGDWSSTSTWETFNGTTWVAATSTPTSSTSVYIEDGDSVFLSANSACKDLNLNTDVGTGDNGRINVLSFTLSVNGGLAMYTGAAPGSAPGSFSSITSNFILTPTGKIQIVGTTRNVTAGNTTWGVPGGLTGWTLEIAMTSGDTAKILSNMRAGLITVTNGSYMQMVTAGTSLRPDGGSNNTGTLTIESGGTFIMSAGGSTSGLFRTSGTTFGTLNLNSGGTLVIPSTASISAVPRIYAQTVNLNGTVICNGTCLLVNDGVSGAASVSTYNNLTLNTAFTVNADATVNGTLTVNAIITTSSSAKLTLGNASASMAAGSSTKFINGPMAITIAAAGATSNKVLEIGKGTDYRNLTLSVTHTDATSSTYTVEVFNTAPTSRTLGALTNVSSTRYWNVTQSGSATVTSATVKVTYGTNDGVSDNTTIQLAKENGTAWTSVGTGGSAQLTGDISGTGFTTFGDFVIANVEALNNGDFRSKQDGSWNSSSTWETWNSTTGTWDAASGTPTSSTDVYIQDGDSVVLTANGSCNDLHLNEDISQGDVGRINTQSFTLSVSGKLRLYSGATGNIPGSNLASPTNNHQSFILTSGGGKIQIVGNSRRLTTTGEWGGPGNFNSWTIEFALNSGQTAKINTVFRAGTFTITSGSIVELETNGSLRPDFGTSGSGIFLINTGGELIINSGITNAGLFRNSTDKFSSFTLSSGATLTIPASATIAPRICAGSVTLNGNIVSQSGVLLQNLINGSSISGAASLNTFGKLTISAATTLTQNITVDTLVLGSTLTTSSSAKLFMSSVANSQITGASSSNFIVGPMSYINTATTPQTMVFEIGKGSHYRPVELTVVQNTTTATTYTAEMFNTAPTARSLASTSLDRVSDVRYFNITSNNASTISSGFVTIHFEADDSVSQASTLRIAKDDGAGNWVDLGNFSVSGVPTGDIISANSFTSFSDFVLANFSGGTNRLPVTWVDISGKHTGGYNEIFWTVTDEHNNKGFEVQRSYNGQDFEKAGFVSGKNTLGVHSYSTTDNMFRQDAPVVYYRIKQIDFDNQYGYSKVIAISSEKSVVADGVTLYPNPAQSLVHVELSEGIQEIPAQVTLLSSSGSSYQVPVRVIDNKTFDLDCSEVPKGVYMISLERSGTSSLIKLLLY